MKKIPDPAADKPVSLDQWLSYLERLHPVSIELGLDRILQVAARLGLDFSGKKIVTVAGTNGKGSSVTLLAAMLQAAGLRTGVYTSPHLLRYNERVAIDGVPVADEPLCRAFAEVEAARGDVSLTYFEFGTLAALQLFAQAPLDYLLLEVGLGGRLDAVNIVDADAAIVTNVALDHMDWLGDTREAIGREKAGVYRRDKPAIYGERDIPASVREHAEAIGAPLYLRGREFDWSWAEDHASWHWRGRDAGGAECRYEALPLCNFALDNVAAVLQALALLEPRVGRDEVLTGLNGAAIAGRFQRFERSRRGCTVLLDVAHNPHAAVNLAASLRNHFPGRPLRLVIAMLGDKDSAGVVDALAPLGAAGWYVGEIREARGAPAKILYNQLRERGEREVRAFAGIAEAFSAAAAEAEAGDVIVVTGSFYTVAAALELLSREEGATGVSDS